MQTIQRFFAGWTKTFKQQGFIGKVIFATFSLLFLCFVCGVPIIILSPSSPTPEVEKVDVSELTSTLTIVETVYPTNIPQIASTATPEPPTPISNPTESRDPYIYLFEVSNLVFLDHDANRGNGAGLKVYMGEQNY